MLPGQQQQCCSVMLPSQQQQYAKSAAACPAAVYGIAEHKGAIQGQRHGGRATLSAANTALRAFSVVHDRHPQTLTLAARPRQSASAAGWLCTILLCMVAQNCSSLLAGPHQLACCCHATPLQWGVAYRLAGSEEQQQQTIAYLEWREKQYDVRRLCHVYTADSPDQPVLQDVLVYLATESPANVNWLGPAPLPAIAQQIATSRYGCLTEGVLLLVVLNFGWMAGGLLCMCAGGGLCRWPHAMQRVLRCGPQHIFEVRLSVADSCNCRA